MANISFGEWLKHKRASIGMTQKQFAYQINCSISALRKWEAELRRPSVQVVERLAEIFDIPQNERKAFLQFARGDWQAMPFEDIEDTNQFFIHQSIPSKSSQILIGSKHMDNLIRSHFESSQIVVRIEQLHQELELAQSLGNMRKQLESLWQLGWLDQSQRFIYWNETLTLTRLLGDTHELANVLSTIGLFIALNGNLDLAQVYLAESTALYQQMHRKPIPSNLLPAYAQIYLIKGDFEKARDYLQEFAMGSLKLGKLSEFLWARVRLGYVALREGNLEEANQIFSEVTLKFYSDKNIIGIVFAFEGWAGLHLAKGKMKQAVRLISWADTMREKISDPRPQLEQADVDKVIADCLAKMGEVVFSEEYDAGKKMTLDEAVEFALEEN